MSNYTDNYSKEPELNFSIYAKELASIAIKATDDEMGGFVVGIFGAWGTGKTTLMRGIESLLNKHTSSIKCRTIWFNPWKYDKKESVWNALIQTILLKIKEDKNQPEILEKIATLSRSSFILSLGLMGEVLKQISFSFLKHKTGITVEDFKPATILSDDLFPIQKLSDYYETVNKFEEDFKEVVKNYVGKSGRLVIFIDDLDRCLPENALAVLEALKLYLDQANCIFFIGIDHRVIEDAVRHRYKDISISAREYIEKMIQLSFFLPEKAPENVRKFLVNRFNALAAANIIDDTLWDAVLEATSSNLRKTKQFIVSWHLVRSLAEGVLLNDKDDIERLAIILLIQMFYNHLYMALTKNGHILIQTLRKACVSDDERGNFIKTNPKYEIYLRDDGIIRFFKKCESEKKLLAALEDDRHLKKLLCVLPVLGKDSDHN